MLKRRRSTCCKGECKLIIQSDYYSKSVYDKRDIYEIPDDMLEVVPSNLMHSFTNTA
jgi:hypothetical protein